MKRSHVWFGAMLLMMYAGSLAALFLVEPPRMSREPLMLLIGSLNAAFGAVVQYLFGSSVGSADKTALLKERQA
ncbi:MAG: hypothetical protein KAY54_10775 [Burkholderiaceae bacterium]|nr:hypothetical protein [Burkholderiaceae bacterium]